MNLTKNRKFHLRACALAFLALTALPIGVANAFSDDEARKAILDLRQRVEEQRKIMEQQANSILSLSNQIQVLRSDVAVLRGRVEELERNQNLQAQNTAPREVTLDGATFTALPQEASDYDAALEFLRKGDYAGATTLFKSFLVRWPSSGYLDSASFWLGNAQYGNSQYQDAVKTFTELVDRAPQHARAPEAWLAIANCQAALKNKSAERSALEKLIQTYPQTQAATDARKRLSQL